MPPVDHAAFESAQAIRDYVRRTPDPHLLWPRLAREAPVHLMLELAQERGFSLLTPDELAAAHDRPDATGAYRDLCLDRVIAHIRAGNGAGTYHQATRQLTRLAEGGGIPLGSAAYAQLREILTAPVAGTMAGARDGAGRALLAMPHPGPDMLRAIAHHLPDRYKAVLGHTAATSADWQAALPRGVADVEAMERFLARVEVVSDEGVARALLALPTSHPARAIRWLIEHREEPVGDRLRFILLARLSPAGARASYLSAPDYWRELVTPSDLTPAFTDAPTEQRPELVALLADLGAPAPKRGRSRP